MRAAAALALGAALALPARAQFEAPDGPRDLPAFDLPAATARSVRRLSSADLRGKVWIADFIYTTCGGQCPLLTARMRALQKSLPKEVLLVSFSVDPERDRPEVLRGYARDNGADPARWFFVTAEDQAALIPLLKDGFGTAYRRDDSSDCGFSTMHSSRFALVGRDGRVFRTYDGAERDSGGRLERDARALLAAAQSPADAAQTGRGARAGGAGSP